jgi:hypothetical protein
MGDLAPGSEAWMIVHGPATSSGRRELLGAARVRVLEVTEHTHRVEVIKGSGVPVGRRFDVSRRALYSVNVPEEKAAYGAEVRRFWPEVGGG